MSLFVRANGVMQPTARAISLRPAVASVLKTIRRDILSQAAFDPASETGVVTLSLSDIGELEFLPRLLARLSIEAPGVTLRAVVERPHKLSVSMDLGEVDLAIGYFPDLVTSSFKQQSLFRHPSACLVRRNHPSVGPDMSLEDYLGARHITVAQEGRTHDVVELGLSAAGLQRNVGLQISHFVSVPFLVAQSDMVATIPRPLAVKFAGVCDLLIVEPPFPRQANRRRSQQLAFAAEAPGYVPLGQIVRRGIEQLFGYTGSIVADVRRQFGWQIDP